LVHTSEEQVKLIMKQRPHLFSGKLAALFRDIIIIIIIVSKVLIKVSLNKVIAGALYIVCG